MIKTIDPYRRKLTLSELETATSVEQIEHLLCPKALIGKTGSECLRCKGLCKAGKKAKELLEKETKPQKQQINGLSGKDDPDYGVYINALREGKPVEWLINGGLMLLSKPPKRKTRREALTFMYTFAEKYEDIDRNLLEDAINMERQKDYDDVRRMLNEGATINYPADRLTRKYGMRPQETLTYIDELQEQYGEFVVTHEQNEKKSFTGDDVDDTYEHLMDQMELLQEEYDSRTEEINEELELVDQMIQMYQEMIEQIQGEEKKLTRYPDAPPKVRFDALEYCEPDIDAHEEEPIFEDEEEDQSW